ncbi:hypothetical protein A2Y47_00675 [Candidatus Giovannonibacteria bacterium RIFCSPLOWO2_12_43_8]|uniref:Uncharacterized protein n=2 Tax=Candidatus Giovannoniibacteriota TaxID=1752738 RepID=A0A1F5WFE7_9BACT|nr:MAG: hypothetical protein A2W57_03235 [Candidatus Giovannonibacteria bacterium RIFCSPHIGHO2_02_43_16]OGF94675.1 MAG: hypothetical protein A2Y47_00675 [Candidatus Giovannonibacteria bacterium RIFCSPLOWO2_12_43_8]
MTKYLKMLLEKIERTDVVSNKGPEDKIKEGEVPEFVLEDDEFRKIYAVLTQSGRNIQKAVSDAGSVLLDCIKRGANPDNDKIVAETKEELYGLASIHTSLRSYFWDSLKYEFPQLLGKTCGIRENWQIVSKGENQQHNRGSASVIIEIPKDLVESLMSDFPGLFSAKKPTFH